MWGILGNLLCIAAPLEGHRGVVQVKKISKLKVLTFTNMVSKSQAKRLINAKVTVSDILGYLTRFSPLKIALRIRRKSVKILDFDPKMSEIVTLSFISRFA